MPNPGLTVDSQRYARVAGLVGGILLFTAMLLAPRPVDLPVPAQRMAAVALLMAAFWIGETLPLGVTALIPLVAFPLLGIMSTRAVAPRYANEWIFLMLGGFFIALAMQKWNLHKRIALHIIRLVGVSARRLVLGFMVATAFISMWVSNTATTLMMIPIALAIILEIEEVAARERPGAPSKTLRNFGVALSLGVAYSANIGGVGTLVGTFPNVVFGGMVESLFEGAPEITFAAWFLFAMPFVICFIPIMWAVLVFWLYPVRGTLIESAGDLIDRELAALGPLRRGELDTLVVACATGLLWILRRDLNLGIVTIPGWSEWLGLGGLVNDATVAIFSGCLLFLIPVNFRKGEYVMDWEWGLRVPWGLLLLFASGFAIAAGFQESGLALWIGNRLRVLGALPVPLMILLVALMITFLTEMTSNTATTTMMMPILAATAVAIGTHPFVLMLPAVVSASCAFMLPIATPPNAIAFSTERITMRQMMRAGFVLNLIGTVLVTVLVMTMGERILGAAPDSTPAWAVLREAGTP